MQALRSRVKRRILGQQHGFPCELGEFLLPVRAAGIDEFGDVPVEVRPGGDDVAVHRPVVVLAEGEAVGRVVVPGLREGNEVGRVDEGDVVSSGQLDPEAAGGALVVVDFEDLAAEGGAATVFEFVFAEGGGLTMIDCGLPIFDLTEEGGGVLGEVAGDEGFPHLAAVPGNGDKEVEAIGEAGVDLAEVGDADLAADRGGAVGLERLPEAVAGEVAEREVGIAPVVVLPDDVETRPEAVSKDLAPRDAVGRGEAFVEKIEDREQEQRLVGPFVRRAFLHRRGADIQVVESFDGLVEGGHGRGRLMIVD